MFFRHHSPLEGESGSQGRSPPANRWGEEPGNEGNVSAGPLACVLLDLSIMCYTESDDKVAVTCS
ncbi:MAG: hypothetical protein OXL95_05680, partial [Nitrospira sp.]|nr:hypothetical protein [Nitrospira sp.]